MVIKFADGTEGICPIGDWQFWEMSELAKNPNVGITLFVQVKDGQMWRVRQMSVRDLVKFTKTYEGGRIQLTEAA